VNRTAQDVAVVYGVNAPGFWVFVPACGQVVSDLNSSASPQPPAGAAIVYSDLPMSPEGGDVYTVVVTSDRVSIEHAIPSSNWTFYASGGVATESATPSLTACAGDAPSTSPLPTNPRPRLATATPPLRAPASGPALRTVDVSVAPSGAVAAYAGIGLEGATLRGDPHDWRVAWLDLGRNGTRRLVFPQGFTARFTPRLEVLDASGQVRFHDGDAIPGACVWGSDLLIGWP
jgi:hypothetical protein